VRLAGGIRNDRPVWNAISRVLFRILTILVAIPVTKVVRRMVHTAWRAARPNNPPRNPWRHDTRVIDAMTWALIVASGRAVRRVFTAKASAELWRAVMGTEPPGTRLQGAPAEAQAAVSPLPVASDRSS
jgi:uncharacterized protein DUF4235